MTHLTSSHIVLTMGTYPHFRKASFGFCFERCTSVNFLPQMNVLCSSTQSNKLNHSPKRRSRGPVIAAKESVDGTNQQDRKYGCTVNLPQTKFEMRANSSTREPEVQKFWDANNIFQRTVDRNKGETFVIHDGPPYANGELHMGHALNKILKDIVNRYKLLMNYKVRFVPGWDCHGLPIELKVLQSLDSASKKNLTPLMLREQASKYAKAAVQSQMESFKRYGVWGDWNNPYHTLDREYEAAQIEIFGKMALLGYIYRGRKPVHWSPSSSTALAEAELEYPEDHSSRSIYAVFRMVNARPDSVHLFSEFFPDLYLAIWTTTPWTIPANVAVAANSKLQYAVVEAQFSDGCSDLSGNVKRKIGCICRSEEKRFIIVAANLLHVLEKKWGAKFCVRKLLHGSDLESCRYVHPIDNRECLVVDGEDSVTIDCGTGLVHTAPGHGQEDYIIGLKYGLPMLSPVDDYGKFTEEAGQFCGLDVLGEGNTAVIKCLDKKMSLIMEEIHKHKYPYDWRTKKPTIFRATEQWFASVEGFQKVTLDAIKHVTWFPLQALNRISSMVSSRSDWCISRQRTWGVPIPVFYNVRSKEPLMNEDIIHHIKSIIFEKGSDAWWYMSEDELLPDKYRENASDYEKGTDTMDVWFDSGCSWAAVLDRRNGLRCPADLYIEGSDQHRGWFQSSLLTCIAVTGKAPYSCVITHGFVLDEKGLKMSKSLGNVVDPRVVIEGKGNTKEQSGYGADVLRLWVSSVDYTDDVVIGSQVLRQISDVYRKLRGTLRYLLGNLHDWNAENSISYNYLPRVDRYALFQLGNVSKNVKEGYEKYRFFKIYQILQKFAVVDLSNFYFDIAKDRLYVGGTLSFTRKSCQTVLVAHLLHLTRLIAPILPHLAEDVWHHLPFTYYFEDGCVAASVFEARWPTANDMWLSLPEEEIEFWGSLLQIRTEVNKVLEMARAQKLIGSSLEAKVSLCSNDADFISKLNELCLVKNDADSLNRIFITSQVELDEGEGFKKAVDHSGKCELKGGKYVWIGVSHAEGSKCERCWNYSTQVGTFPDHPSLCKRCFDVVCFC